VTDVADGCAASGLVMKGDNILFINGTRVADEVQGRALARAAVGKVIFSVLRGDNLVTVAADKPEVTTRLGVTFKDPLTRIKDKQYLYRYAAKPLPVATVVTAEIEEDFEDVYFEGPPARGRYNQWPGLCDCFSARNCLCCYGTCCTPCLAGQMYSNLFETRGKPGCCMNLCLLYTLGTIFAYVLLMLPGILRAPEFATIAERVSQLMLLIVSASVCWTLIKASRLPSPRSCSFVWLTIRLHSCCMSSSGVTTHTPRTACDLLLPG